MFEVFVVALCNFIIKQSNCKKLKYNRVATLFKTKLPVLSRFSGIFSKLSSSFYKNTQCILLSIYILVKKELSTVTDLQRMNQENYWV